MRIFAGDIGNGFAKAQSSTALVSFPSVIAIVAETMTGFDPEISPNNNFVIEFAGRNWAIGETVHTHGATPEVIVHRSRVTQEHYRVLFAAAMTATIKQSSALRVLLSLPPAMYWDKEELKDALAGDYVVKYGGRTHTYSVPRDRLQVVPEGFGGAVALCLDTQGRVRDRALLNKEVGIVDVGTHTTNCLQLSSLKPVRAGTDSIPHALHDIHKNLQRHLSSHGVSRDIHKADVDLRRGYFLKVGQQVSIDEERERWSKDLARAIAGHISTLWNGGHDVERILIIGGGARYVAPFLTREFPHAHAVEKSETGVEAWAVNCVGGYRYLMLQQAQRG